MSDNIFYPAMLAISTALLFLLIWLAGHVTYRPRPVYFITIQANQDCIDETDWKAVIKKCVRVDL